MVRDRFDRRRCHNKMFTMVWIASLTDVKIPNWKCLRTLMQEKEEHYLLIPIRSKNQFFFSSTRINGERDKLKIESIGGRVKARGCEAPSRIVEE